MKMKMKNRIIGVIGTLIALTALIGVNTFAHPCRAKMAMACNYSTKGAVLVLILITAAALSKVFITDEKTSSVTDIITAVGAVELLFTKSIGSCKMDTMSCNTKTFPTLTVAALLLILLTLISFLLRIISLRRRKNADRE